MYQNPDYPGKTEHELVMQALTDLITGYELEIKECYQKVYAAGLPENSPLLNPPKYQKPVAITKPKGTKKKHDQNNGE